MFAFLAENIKLEDLGLNPSLGQVRQLLQGVLLLRIAVAVVLHSCGQRVEFMVLCSEAHCADDDHSTLLKSGSHACCASCSTGHDVWQRLLSTGVASAVAAQRQQVRHMPAPLDIFHSKCSATERYTAPIAGFRLQHALVCTTGWHNCTASKKKYCMEQRAQPCGET